ncbi:MAG TPA: carboxypeptidase-like regulatory domain-containing protein [Armatimonadota bacterium]|jgi:hypothetical protein
MFLRIAAKGTAVWLGLVTAVLPVSAGGARMTVLRTMRPAPVAVAARKPAPKPKKPAMRGPNYLGIRALPVFPLRVAAPGERTASASQARARSSQKTHGGTPDIDTNTTNGSYNSVEPKFLSSGGVAYTANGPNGSDNYPPPAPDITKDPNADPPLGIQMPPFLVGANDYHIRYRTPAGTVLVRVAVGDNEVGEQFEPTANKTNTLGFTAFLGIHHDIYKPNVTVTLADGTQVTLDYHGFPVRTICLSDDALATSLTGDNGTISKILQPDLYGVGQVPITGTDGTVTNKYMPLFTPDATPIFYPNNSRYVFFVSLRGYDPKNPATQVTSLWMWDTAKAITDAGYVQKIYSSPTGKSVLYPRFSVDGTYLTWTEADIKYPMDEKTGAIQDPVFDIDVSRSILQTPFASRVFLGKIAVRNPPADNKPASASIGGATQLTLYVDEKNDAPRDMMSFFNGLNQVGFSSDRLDKDGDGLADGVETDPTKALFDIYVYPFPYDPNCSDESVPDSMAHRQTLGDKMVPTIPTDPTSPLIHFDDSNELYGDAAPVNYGSDLLSLMTPNIMYQADDRIPTIPPPTTVDPNDLGWDIWTTNRAGAITSQGDILNGLPVVTPDQDLPAVQQSDLVLTHRKGFPSDYVNITVNVNPKYYHFDDTTKAPTTEVYALVKDPDNRIYRSVESEVAPSVTFTADQEVDAFPVKFCKPDFDAYTAAWGGKAGAPQIGALIKLKAVNDTPNPLFPVAYTGKWYTPAEVSDFMIDIIVKVPPIPATQTTPAIPAHSYITDNIGGFSTAPFIPTSRVLVVSDFAAGQKSMDDTTGGSAARYGTNGVRTESYFLDHPGPSVTSDGIPIFSQKYGGDPWAVFGPRREWQTEPTLTEDPISHRLVAGNDGLLNAGDPLFVDSAGHTEYDLWRTQCREPITLDDVKESTGRTVSRGVLHNYLPYTHSQPGYPIPSVLRTQRVADRCVVWVSPHTGNLNGNAGQNSAEVGTIANLSTQGELVNYMNRGGRLMLAGADVAYVLSGDNPNSSNALLARMKVAFQSDADVDEVSPFQFHRTNAVNAKDGSMFGLNPIPYVMVEAPLAPHWPGGEPTNLPLHSPRGNPDHESRADGSLSNYHQDGITGVDIGTVGGAEPVYYYATSDVGDKTLLCAVQTHIPVTSDNASASKTFFMSFNPDAISRGYAAPTGTPPYVISPNNPATMFHNVVDYFCTGGFLGNVFITTNVSSLKNVLVYAVDDYNAEAAGNIRGTALTDDTGFFTMDGLEPSIYRMYAYKVGFAIGSHEVRDAVDTMRSGYTRDNITLVPTQPGSLAGTVYQKGTSPRLVLAGVPVTLTDITGAANMMAITDANGQFAFINIPTGFYTITTPYGQWKAGVYYAAYTNPVGSLTITTGVNKTFDIALTTTTPITISGNVTDADTGNPVSGVTVTVTDATGANTATAVSDTAGYYAFGDLPNGAYTVTTPEGQYTMVISATKSEQHYYAATSNAGKPLAVTQFGNVSFPIVLTRTAPKPATIVVSVKDAFTLPAKPAQGAVITVIDVATGAPAVPLDSGLNPITTTVTGDPTDGTGTFKVNSGTYTITVTYQSLAPQSKTIIAAPDDPADPTKVNQVNFEFGVIHTFTAGSVLMASLPYDYSGTTSVPITFSKVLTLTNAQLANAVVGYNAGTQAFVFYPNNPADTARLGRGYGFKLPADGKVVDQGTSMSGTTGIIRTDIGWNLIGDPWPGTVVWNGTGTDSVRVTLRDDATQTKMTIDDAKTKGYILSDLWGGSSVDANGNSVYSGTYQVASPTMSLVPWRGYWVKVAQPLLFYVPKPAVPAGANIKAVAEIEAMKGALMPAADKWGMNITASADGMTDNGLALGISSRATAGIDPGLDLAKPLPMSGGKYLYTAFPMGSAGAYATDVRSPGALNIWTINVSTSLNARMVTLTWTPVGSLPAGYTAWLVDSATGQRTNMSAVNQYAFRSARDGGVRTFRVETRRAGVSR